MSIRLFLLSLSIAFCNSVEAVPYISFNGKNCDIEKHVNVSKYLGKSYKILPKEILNAGPPFGNVKHHTIWGAEDSTLKYFGLLGKDVEGIFFDVYKWQIISVGIYFSDKSIENGEIDVDQILNSCGKRMSQYCSVHNKDIELIVPNKNTITVQYPRAMAIMYDYPRKNSPPCAP